MRRRRSSPRRTNVAERASAIGASACARSFFGHGAALDTRGTFELRDQPAAPDLPVIGCLQEGQRGVAPVHAAILLRFRPSHPPVNPLFRRQCPACCFLSRVTYGATVSAMVRGPACGPECDREADMPLSMQVARTSPAGPLAAPHEVIPAWDRIFEGSLHGRDGPPRRIQAGPPGFRDTRPMCAIADE